MTWRKGIMRNSRKARRKVESQEKGRQSLLGIFTAIVLAICAISVEAADNAEPADAPPRETPAETPGEAPAETPGGTPAEAPGETPAGGKDPKWWDYSFSKGGFQLEESERTEDRLTLGGETFGRYAYWNWFEGPSHDNEYDYGFQRTRLNLKYTSKYWSAFLQPQHVHMFGVPDDAFKRPPEGPLGMGGLYYIHNNDTEPCDFGLHQAYAALHSPGGRGWLIKGGRFEYSDGLEVLDKTDGKHFNALKKMRVGDRMISPFGWSAFARSFDGVLGQYDHEKVNVTGSFFYPTQGGWEENIHSTIDDIRITTFTLTGKRGTIIPGMELAGFYYNYRDDRDVTQRVDNTGPMFTPGGVDIDIHMFGGHAVGVYDAGPGKIDVLLWGGAQCGEWYELDQQAYAFSAEGGYQFTEVFAKPWLRAGYYVGSGDSDANDGYHETFFQMAPGTRKYNLLPYCDLMNIEDTFVQLITHPTRKLMLRADYHLLRLNEDRDRWYMGSGPTQRRGQIFGYLWRPTGAEDDLAQEIDFMLNYQINPHWSVMASYSHIFGGDVVRGVYGEDDDADYVSIGMMCKW